ncbi:MAG: hypothetical protein KC635_21340 [Myxococcales bacterium]|nr:hypothetical protein [Myxococcales bacterium]MCB9731255.1 hypothetical protein [Deltaproteobacteria bacterium]
MNRIRTLTTLGTALAALLLTAAIARAEAPKGAVEKTLSSAFQAALAGDFDAYLKTIHPDERANDTQKRDLERFSWERFKRQAAWYLTDKDPATFEIVKRDESGDDQVRVFVKDKEHGPRMPVPVRLKKTADGEWLITANSL